MTQPLLIRQEATRKARERMFEALVGFEPCRTLTIGDVKFIADWASTVTFDAIKQVDEEEGR